MLLYVNVTMVIMIIYKEVVKNVIINVLPVIQLLNNVMFVPMILIDILLVHVPANLDILKILYNKNVLLLTLVIYNVLLVQVLIILNVYLVNQDNYLEKILLIIVIVWMVTMIVEKKNVNNVNSLVKTVVDLDNVLLVKFSELIDLDLLYVLVKLDSFKILIQLVFLLQGVKRK